MLLKILRKMFIIALTITLAAGAAGVWLVSTDTGLNALLSFADGTELDSPLGVYFGEVHGSLLRGFTVSDIRIVSGDSGGVFRAGLPGAARGADTLLDVGSVTLAYSVSLLGGSGSESEKKFSPEGLIISGVSAQFEDIMSLADYAASFSGGGGEESAIKPVLLDFALLSSDISGIPNLKPVRVSEISLSRSGDLQLDLRVGDLRISADQNISTDRYLDMCLDSLGLKVGEGSVRLSAALFPFPSADAEFSGLRAAELLGVSDVSFGADARVAGSAAVRFSEDGFLGASGDLKLDEIKVEGVPVSSFSAPWSFISGSGGDGMTLKFPKIGATVRGMENLKGWAYANIDDMSGAFALSGEKLSLSDLERTFKLGYPIEGENGKFHLKVRVANAAAASGPSVSGDIRVSIPSVRIGKQKIDDLDLTVSVKNGAADGKFKAKLLGAPLSGEGRFSLTPPYNISLTTAMKGLESSNLASLVPGLADAKPKGRITADVKIGGTLSAITADAAVKSDRLSAYGLDLRKISLSVNSSGGKSVNYTLTSSGSVTLNTSGQINVAERSISGKGSAAFDAGAVPALASSVKGKVSSSFEISGKLADPAVTVRVNGKDNSFAGIPVMNTSLSARYSGGRVTIADSNFQLDKDSSLSLNGGASLKAGEPNLDISGALKNIELKPYGINTNVNGLFKVSGAASNPSITGEFATPEDLKSGDAVNVKIRGSAKAMGFELIDTRIAGGTLNGRGRVEQSGRFLPWIDLDVSAVNLKLSELLKSYGIESPVGGVFTGHVRARRTPDGMSAEIRSRFPLTVNKLMIDRFAVRVISEKRGEIGFRVRTLVGDALRLRVSGKLLRKKGGWTFSLASDKMDAARLMQIATGSPSDSIAGDIVLSAEMDLSPGGKMVYTLESPNLDLAGFKIDGLRVPFEYTDDKIVFKVDRGSLGGALIVGDGMVDLENERWRAALSMRDIQLEKLVEHLLAPRGGKLTGKGQARIRLHGTLGVMPNVLGGGSFTAANGALEGMNGMETINAEKRVEFESAKIIFFFNGRDVVIGESSVINSPPGYRYYRHMRFAGPVGLSGQGMDIAFSARINIAVLNSLIGAFQGLVNLAGGAGDTSGGLLLDPAKEMAAKMLGLERIEFSNVKFNLRGGWGSPTLSGLKLDKQLTLPVPKGEGGGGGTERRIDIKINIPVGPGSSDMSTSDAIKRGIFDGLFDSVAPEINRR